jgi:hypothetical protein
MKREPLFAYFEYGSGGSINMPSADTDTTTEARNVETRNSTYANYQRSLIATQNLHVNSNTYSDTCTGKDRIASIQKAMISPSEGIFAKYRDFPIHGNKFVSTGKWSESQ